MPKLSILIPAYNAEQSISKCLDSILSQKGDYEILVIDDCSKDKTYEVLKTYKDKITYLKNKENKGVSYTRNELIKKANGKYLTFIDSDDYIKPNFINKIESILKDNKDIDVISYCMETIDTNGNLLSNINKPNINKTTGEELFITFVEQGITFDTPVGYIYKKDYLIKNNFFYAEGYHHEDFGLTPLVLVYSKSIISIPDSYYCYVQTSESITRSINEEKLKKNAYDMLHHFDVSKNIINKDNELKKETKEYFNSFLANALILKLNSLPKQYQNEYKRELKKRNITSMLLANNLKRKIKKIIITLKFI